MNKITTSPAPATWPAKKIPAWAWITAAFVAAVAFLSVNEAAPTLILVAVAVAAYFFPTIVAGRRHHHNVGAVAVVNFFLGWTLIGWVVALAMAATAVRPSRRP